MKTMRFRWRVGIAEVVRNVAIIRRGGHKGAETLHHMAEAYKAARPEGATLARSLAASYLAVAGDVAGDRDAARRLQAAIDEFWRRESERSEAVCN
jgi:hypothetical protein